MKRTKLLLSTLAITSLSTGFLPLVSCNANKDTTDYTSLSEQIKTTAIEEFFKLSARPRPSFECGKIYLYLKDRIQELGFGAHDVGAGSEQPGRGPEGQRLLGQYNNIYFDIPASIGCENYEPVILQAHMDMVRTGEGAGPGETKYLEEGVEPVITELEGEPVIQTVGKKTSLGSDNGMGVATILSLAIHRNEFKHGWIRCLFTYDEEVGLYGAEDIKAHSPHFFDGFKHVINIDSEEDCGIVYESYGIAKTDFWVASEAEPIKPANVVEIKLHGLHGGHSGADIGNGYANAERLVYETLYSLMNDTSIIQLIQCDHKNKDGSKETSPAHNSLISDFNLWIETNISIENIKSKFEQLRDSSEPTGWKNKYSGENWDNISFEVVADTSLAESTVCLSEFVSEEYITLMGNKFLCGVHDMRDVEKHVPGTSGNVGPTAFQTKETKVVINSTHGIRSDKDEILQYVTNDNPESVPEEWKKYNHYKLLYEKLAPKNAEITSQLCVLGWHAKSIEDGNILMKLLAKGFRDIAGKQYVPLAALGSLECTTFYETNPNLNIISTGSKIRYPHSNDETFYINSYVNFLKSLLYTLVHAHELN